MDRLKLFERELSYIKDTKIKEFTEKTLLKIPEYFFEVPASSTGKYHPSYALGEGGLVRHTKAAVRIAIELFRMDCFKYTDTDKDMIIASLILHDGCKSGLNHSKYTVTEHPLIVAQFIRDDVEINSCIDASILNTITTNIESHMGIWNYDYKTKKEVLPKPQTNMQRFVHLCDYLASRKCLEFNFDVDVIRE
jgi:23S rRNA maturation-related 3'-5' exoribonuclease YhaM